MNWNTLCAGIFAGFGALFLLYKGEIAAGAAILSGMLAFFVGDSNGRNSVEKKLLKQLSEELAKTEAPA